MKNAVPLQAFTGVMTDVGHDKILHQEEASILARALRMSNTSSTPIGIACDPLLLVEEIQHRVTNEYAIAISSIHLLARSCDEHTQSILASVSQRLLDFATVHHALQPPKSDRPLELCFYLREVCLALTRARLAESGVSLTLNETPVMLEARRAWRVGLIVSELITNAVRHGNWPPAGGAIEVQVMPGVRHVQCRVSDNGIGANLTLPGRGTRILEALAGELGGQVRRAFSDAGAAVVLTFPRDHGAEWIEAANGDPTDRSTLIMI